MTTAAPARRLSCATPAQEALLRQRGQILPLATVLLLVVLASVLLLFNSGQLISEKLRLNNTADAVAYSAGVFEARLLNYDAYTNRAIVANEIAIAQAVGVASWVTYMGRTADSIGPWLYLLPHAGPALKHAMDHLKSIAEVLAPALAATIPVHDAALQALALSQELMHGPDNGFALAQRRQLMARVARANDPDVEVDSVPLSDDFGAFTQRYEDVLERQRLGQLVDDSREHFLRSRDWDFGELLLCLGIRLRKRGSTELINLVDGWKSMDTLSAHRYRLRRLRCRRSESPLGYGSAAASPALPDAAYSYGGSRRDNPRASTRADNHGGLAAGFEPPPLLTGAGAIPATYGLSRAALGLNAPSTALSIRVIKRATRQRFSGGLSSVRPAGRLERFAGRHANDHSAAIARVEVHFARPDAGNPRYPGRQEIGSLFNPYWQARLAPLSSAERLAAQLRQGSTRLP